MISSLYCLCFLVCKTVYPPFERYLITVRMLYEKCLITIVRENFGLCRLTFKDKGYVEFMTITTGQPGDLGALSNFVDFVVNIL